MLLYKIKLFESKLNKDNSDWKNSFLFQKWEKKFLNSGCKISDINCLGSSTYGGSLKTLFLSVKFVTPENHFMERSILIRNESVVIIPFRFLGNQPRFLCVMQRRITDGNISIEFPAGAVDDFKSPREAAVLELYEETGLKLKQKKLISLKENLRLSESLVDEIVHWYGCDIAMCDNKNDYMDELKIGKKKYGNMGEGEHIKIEFITLEKLKKIKSFHMRIALSFINNELSISCDDK